MLTRDFTVKSPSQVKRSLLKKGVEVTCRVGRREAKDAEVKWILVK